MTKRVIALCLCIVLLFSVTAHGTVRSAGARPTLSFNGTTANCRITINCPGQRISVKMELWCGNTKLKTWTKTGTSYVSLSKTSPVVNGNTYTLVVSGTAGGESINATTVTNTCP